MKKLLVLMITSTSLLLASCGSNSYPTTSSDQRYPRTTSTYPRNETILIDKDGRVVTRDGRVVGNARRSSGSYRPGGRRDDRYNNNQVSVLRLDDRYARRDNAGRLYCVDQFGNVYWRSNDGYYYLDNKYAQGNGNNRNRDRDYRSGRRY